MEIARERGSPVVSPEHFSLVLIRDHDSLAMRALTELGINAELLRQELLSLLPERDPSNTQEPNVSRSGIYVFAFSVEEAVLLGNESVGIEHILLSLIREKDSPSGKVFSRMGVTLEATRKVVKEIQKQDAGGQSPSGE